MIQFITHHPTAMGFIAAFGAGWTMGRGALRNGLQRANEKIAGKR